MDFLKAEDVRAVLVDTRPEDNDLLEGLDFSDTQISMAMRLAVTAINDLGSRALQVESASKIPFAEWTILAVQEQLYKMRLNQLERNAIQYQAGNTSFDEDNIRIKYLRSALAQIGQEWRRTAILLKHRANMSNVYHPGF